MKRISLAALPLFILIFLFTSAAHAQSSPEGPQTHVCKELNHAKDKVPPTKQVPEIGPPENCPGNCPQSRYLDCMPPVKEENRLMCTRECLEWIKEHCPNVEVVY
jgi:hypothetical protein